MSLNYYPCFDRAANSWNERWQVLREFIHRWHQIELKLVGARSALVEQEEAKLNLQLPSSLREWIGFSEELLKQNKFSKILRDNYEVVRLKEHRAISLMLQAEGDYYWAVSEDNLSLEDPPVDGYLLDYDTEKFGFFMRESDRLTSFVLEHMSDFLRVTGGTFVVDLDLESRDRLLDEMQASFTVYARWDSLNIFESENILAIVFPNKLEPEQYILKVLLWRSLSTIQRPECLVGRWSWFQKLVSGTRIVRSRVDDL